MDHALSEPSLAAYASHLAGFCVRYFVLAGGIYVLFHRLFRRRWQAYRIQQPFPSRRIVGYEIGWSLLNAACTGASTMLIYWLARAGRSSMYRDVGEYGWRYLGASAALVVVGYDAWIYWQHRWMHTPWLFRHVHAVHHRVRNPTAFGAFAQHPLETFLGNAYFVLIALFVPIHALAVAAAGGFLFVVALLAHSGYEFYPRGFTRHPLLGWLNTSTHHNMHHSRVGCNYGLCLNVWDRLLGTNDAAYHQTFDAIARRRGQPVDPPTAFPAVEQRAA